MRWIWIDRFTEFKSGISAKSIKNISLAEEHLHDHFPGFAVMPGSLIIEGFAQTGGILLGEKYDFEHIVILAKVNKSLFHSWACPGDTLEYRVKLIAANEAGGQVECTAHVGDRLVAEADLMFFHLDQTEADVPAMDQKNFVFSMNLLSVMDVGRAGDGSQT